MQTFRYGPAASQVGDLYLPKATKRPPVICLLHGGFWRLPYARDQMVPMAEDLARRGYAAWNLEYRRLGEKGGGWPNTLMDASAGIELLAKLDDHGAELDLERVVTVGHSAGGHLALWLAGPRRFRTDAAPHKVKVMAAVGQAPAADLKRVYELNCSNGVAKELTGGTPEEFPERYALGSPMALLPLHVPQLVVHGTADDCVPFEIGRDYATAARAAGDPAEFLEVPGMGHFEHLDPKGPAWQATSAWLERVVKA
jgi:acetyl esterase/lipase